MPITGTIITKFKTKRALRVTQTALGKAYKAVAREMQTVMRRRVSKAYPPASSPGSFPHTRTGRFKAGINVTGTKNGITVASRERYGLFLETGTSTMAPRTWANRVLRGGNNAQKWNKKIAALALKFSGGKAKKGRR